ncbi:MAG: cytochrome c biogenesis protein ResB [Nocardioidaceae bacterium]
MSPSDRPDDFIGSPDSRRVVIESDSDRLSSGSSSSHPLTSGARGRPVPPALKPLEFARWIWRQLTSMRTALILLFSLALAAVPGSLVPQERIAPSEVFSFQERHPKLTPLFEEVGLFNVYGSVWFGAIYVLLMLSLVGCIIPRTRVYLRGMRARPPHAPRNLSRLSAYDTWTTDEPPAIEADRARDLLASQRRRVEVYEPVDGTMVVSAEKGFLREAGNLLFHVALLVVLAGVAISKVFGFEGSAAVVVGDGFSNTLIQYDEFKPGARFDAAELAPFGFTVDDFNVEWERSGAGAGTPLFFDADLTVTPRPGDAAYDYRLRVNHPLTVDGTSVYLVGHGYAPIVTVRDGKGNIAVSGPVIFLPQDSSFLSFGVIKAADAAPTQLAFEGYFFPTAAVTGPEGQPYSSFPDADNPVLSLIAYQGDLGLDSGKPQSVYVLDKSELEPFESAAGKPRPLLLTEGETIRLGDGQSSITFDGYQRWVQLQISSAPGKVVPLVGVLAAILGLLASLFVRPRRTWVRVRDDEGRTVVEVAALDRVAGGDPAAHVADIARLLRPARAPVMAEEKSP